MAKRNKPYRVYRGGRARGSVPRPRVRPDPDSRPPTPQLPPRPPEPDSSESEPYVSEPEELLSEPELLPHEPSGPDRPGEEPYPVSPEPRPRRRGWIRLVLVVLFLAVFLIVVWLGLGFLAFRNGVQDANDRLDAATAAALAPQNGLVLSNPSNLLLIGVDRGLGPGREGRGRADAIVLIRTDPDDHRISVLSIPRDLRVEIPGRGPDKINSAYAVGGPALTVNSVQELTGLSINHVAVVDFSTFPEVVDALGGITVDVPRPIVSNRFDCPYGSQAECTRWSGWRYAQGVQEMDGRRALVYSRIRENQLDAEENDLTRGGRQQQVIEAIADDAVSFSTFLRLPFVGDDLVKPLATDLSAWEVMQLGWVKFRASSDKALRCRLGGTPTQIGDGSYLVGSEENDSVVTMILGESPPLAPPDSDPFAPGCFTG